MTLSDSLRSNDLPVWPVDLEPGESQSRPVWKRKAFRRETPPVQGATDAGGVKYFVAEEQDHMPSEVYMPKMSDHMQTGTILKWLVEEGDEVEEHQPLFEVETDKAIGEVESRSAGVIRGIRAREGTEVPVGEVIAFIVQAGEEVPSLPPLFAESGEAAQEEASDAAAAGEPSQEVPRPRAAPAARRMAKELGVDLAQVKGTGPEGRIKVEDVRAYAGEGKAPEAPQATSERVLASPVARRVAEERGVDLRQVAGSGPGGRITKSDVVARAEAAAAEAAEAAAVSKDEFDWVELSNIRRITAQRMAVSKKTVPHFALSVEIDMSEARLLRDTLMERVVSETGTRLSYTAVIVKAVALALTRHPLANAEFVDDRIKTYRDVNVGVAVGVDDGLVVPVVRDADEKTLAEIASELKSFQEKAETLRLAPEDLAGGTFTVTNLGMFGIDDFTAIINIPQSAILAVGRIADKPVALDGAIHVRPMMGATLSVDHRVLDGLSGARFLNDVKRMLENPYLWV